MANPLISYRKHELHDFLDMRIKKGKESTLTGMDELKGSWLVTDEDYPTLLNLLNDYLFVKKNRALGFVERPRLDKEKPFLIDLDFHYKKEQALVRSFTDQHIRDFCSELKDALNHFFTINGYEKIRFFVTLRPQPYADKDKIKDGIHIMSPDIAITNDKWNVLRKYLLNKNVIKEIFDDTGYYNPDVNVYDESMGRQQGWMFYGASKANIPAYELKHVYSYIPETDEWEDEDPKDFSPRTLMELLSVRYNVTEDDNKVRDEAVDEFQALSRPVYVAPLPVEEPPVPLGDNPVINALLPFMPQATDDDFRITERVVKECLSEERSSDRDGWIRTGWCLHNIERSERCFDLWMDFSKKSPKFRENDIGQLRRDWFGGMRMEGDGPRLGVRSLHKWARDDNLKKYNEIISDDTNEFIIRQTDTTHYHISRLMKKMYGSIVTASISSRTTDWYMYDDVLNMWRHLNQGIEFRKKICIDVADQIQSACDRISARYINARNEDDRRQNAEKQKQLHEMQIRLYNTGFNDSVMKMNQTLFADEEFIGKLNVNPYLFGCANGILELRHKGPRDTREHVIFRQGRPEDYVSFLAGKMPDLPAINYKPYDPNDPRQKEIQDFFEKLFPRPDLRKHVLKVMASSLEGMNREQLFTFFIGRGSNGKSKLVRLMELTLGDYQKAIQSTVFTRKRPDSGAANPDIIVAKGRRFLASQEPDDKEPLNTSRMKQMSGEDMIEARALFQDQESFKIMGKIFMSCNTLPPIHSMDNGTWRRIRVFLFESRFEPEDHPDLIAKKPNFFVRDNFLDEKLMSWREPFLSLLVKIYEEEYIPNGLFPEPPIVKQESEKYKSSHDSFAKFRIERIRERKDGFEEVTNEKVTLKDICKCYKRWAEATSAKRLDIKEIENRCSDAFGDSKNNTYTHIRVFLEDEEVEEFDKQHAELQLSIT